MSDTRHLSTPELLRGITEQLQLLVKTHVELAKTEVREDAGRAGKAAAMLGGAGLAGWLTLLFLSLALAWLLDQELNTALSFLIVAVIWAVAGMIMLSIGSIIYLRVSGFGQDEKST